MVFRLGYETDDGRITFVERYIISTMHKKRSKGCSMAKNVTTALFLNCRALDMPK